VLDHRVYRAAFLPALVALFVVAFSLTDPPKPQTTTLAPVAFDAARTFGRADPPPRNSVRELAATFPDRRPGSPGDAALADRVASVFRSTGFAGRTGVRRRAFVGDTIDGPKDLEDVIAVRQGLSSKSIVVIAHRDAAQAPAAAEVSGTAVLLEIARLLADRDLRKTVVLASVSGGSGGFAGARRVVKLAPGEVDAVLVLGDMASDQLRRPFVVPWSNGAPAAPWGLMRTAQSALRAQLAGDPGRWRATVQWARRAMPLTLSEQGAVGAAGLPAILISASGERTPAPDAALSRRRLRTFGEGVLRTLTATLEAGGIEADPAGRRDRDAFPGGDGIVVMKRLMPDWAVRLLTGALLLPVLLTAFDGFFRARRRGLPVGRWVLWTVSFAIPLLLAWAWARALDLAGGVNGLPAPAIRAGADIGAGEIAAMASVLLVLAGGWFGVRALLLRRLGPTGSASAGGAAAAAGLFLAVLVACVWVVNPYAALVLLPAAHVWLLAGAPAAARRRGLGIAVVAAGLLLPAALVAYYVHAWGLGPVELLTTSFGLVAGGVLGWPSALALSGFAAALCATVVILRSRDRRLAAAPQDPIVTRGPRSYAGPGSLGGTESALRR